MTASRMRAAAALALVGFGLWQLGAGGWIHAKAWLAQRLLASAWQETMANGNAAKPWAWADTHPLARLRVPAHGIDQIVLAGSSGSSLAFAPGHVDGSPAPGEPGSETWKPGQSGCCRLRVRPGPAEN